MSDSPAIKLSHSSQTAKAASAAIDSTAMKRPMIDATCRGAPAETLNSQGEHRAQRQVHGIAELSPRPLLHDFLLPSGSSSILPTSFSALISQEQIRCFDLDHDFLRGVGPDVSIYLAVSPSINGGPSKPGAPWRRPSS
jgi:hypothetical protein